MPGRWAPAWTLGLLLALPAAGQEEATFADCERGLVESPADFKSAQCFYRVARQSNRWREASVRLQERMRAQPDLPWLGFYLGSIAMDQGEAEAADIFAATAETFAAQGDAAGETYSRINRARLLERSGRLEEALEESSRTKAAARTGADPALLLEVRMLELRFRFLLGDERVGVQRDLEALESALGEDASYALRRDVTNYLAATAYELGEDREALDGYEKAAALARDAGDKPAQAASELSALRVTMARWADVGWQSAARRRATAVVAAAADAGMPAIEAAARITLGRLTTGTDGDVLLAEGLRLARGLEDAELERDALGYLALRRLDQPRQAMELAEASLAAARRGHDPLSLAARWLEQFTVRWQVAGPDAALAHAEEVFDLLEATSRAESSDSGRARLFSVWSEAYYWMAGRLFEQAVETLDREPLERAFGIQERMRARLLEEPSGAGEPAALLSLAELEEGLTADEALISFQLVEELDAWGQFAGGAWLTLSTRQGTELLRVPDASTLTSRIAMYLALVERREGLEAEAGAALFRDVLGEAVASLPLAVERLILVPDGPLHLVPFAALPDDSGSALGTRFALSQIPSVSVWRRLRGLARPAADAGIVAVVDPSGAGIPADGAAAASSRSWLGESAAELGPLRFARREGKALRRRLGSACMVLAGTAAAEGEVKARLPGSRLVHFATHALVDTRSPERSAVVLAADGDDDGLLAAPEIADLDLRGPVVVLSTCDSAAGPLLRGEGVMSLARSFFRGGARTVVASLWRLRDREAAELFDRFYLHLSRGLSVSRALSAAQSDLLRQGVPTKAWAGLTVLGDGSWVPVPDGSLAGTAVLGIAPGWWLIGGVLLVACLTLVLLFQRRRRAH